MDADLLHDIVSAALRSGADAAEAAMSERKALSVSVRLGDLEERVTGACLLLVAVALRVLRLHDDAGTGLDDGGGMNRPVGVEDLRHADFAADDACNHKNELCRFRRF